MKEFWNTFYCFLAGVFMLLGFGAVIAAILGAAGEKVIKKDPSYPMVHEEQKENQDKAA